MLLLLESPKWFIKIIKESKECCVVVLWNLGVCMVVWPFPPPKYKEKTMMYYNEWKNKSIVHSSAKDILQQTIAYYAPFCASLHFSWSSIHAHTLIYGYGCILHTVEVGIEKEQYERVRLVLFLFYFSLSLLFSVTSTWILRVRISSKHCHLLNKSQSGWSKREYIKLYH